MYIHGDKFMQCTIGLYVAKGRVDSARLSCIIGTGRWYWYTTCVQYSRNNKMNIVMRKTRMYVLNGCGVCTSVWRARGGVCLNVYTRRVVGDGGGDLHARGYIQTDIRVHIHWRMLLIYYVRNCSYMHSMRFT